MAIFQRKMSSDDELSSNTSSLCDVESLQIVVEGGIFQFDRTALSNLVVEEGDTMEEDEDDKDGIRFFSL